MRKDAYSDEDSKFGFPRSFDWAEQAFFGSNSDNKGPDAINLWIGDERAVSAMHKDHYENLFYVLSGEKVFSLCPPADAPFLYEQQVISGRFTVCQDTQGDNNRSIGNQVLQNWHVSLDTADAYPIPDKANGNSSAKVHWIAADPFGKQEDEFPLLRYTHPIPDIRVKAGELLYLPSLWFHSVTQVCETIGINYWYDMNFESPLWCYFHFLQQLKAQMGNEKMADVS
jgi:jumonji domain-containing protein 7